MNETTDAARAVRSMRLIQALRQGALSSALEVLELPLEPNFIDPRGVTPLMVAAYRGYSEVCGRLIQQGADPLYERPLTPDEDPEKWPPFDDARDRARMSRDPATIRVVERAWIRARWKLNLQHPKDADFMPVGKELLVDAARQGMLDLVVEMMSAGIPIDHDVDPECAAIVAAGSTGEYVTCAILGILGADLAWLSTLENISGEFIEAIGALRSLCIKASAGYASGEGILKSV